MDPKECLMRCERAVSEREWSDAVDRLNDYYQWQHEYQIGTHFLSALINGDFSGLDDSEFAQFDRWETGIRISHGGIGHWTTVDDSAEEFEVCDVTGKRGNTEHVAYMAPTGD